MAAEVSGSPASSYCDVTLASEACIPATDEGLLRDGERSRPIRVIEDAVCAR